VVVQGLAGRLPNIDATPWCTVDERLIDMKKILGAAALVLLFSVPALAQYKPPSGPVTYSGGGGGGGALSGGSTGSRLPNYAPAQFATAAASGSDSTFAPSTFLTFDQAVAEGKAEALAVHKSLAEVAAENNARAKAKAKYAFVQDTSGRVVTTPQQ
jgi:hypothetical protein